MTVLEKESYLKSLKRKLNSYLRHESTVYFKMEERLKKNLSTDVVLESKASFYDTEITKLQKEIKELQGDMV